VAGALLVVREVAFRDRSRRVTTEDALSRFRDEASSTTSSSTAAATKPAVGPSASIGPTPPAAATALPALGVYRYRTSGQESVDVLGGAHHAYPAETTVTVTSDGCGVRLRWDALRERRDEWRLCATPTGITEAWALQYHEFFKQPDPEALVCPADTLLLPREPRAGATWAAACTLAKDPEPQQFTVVGTESIEVGGTMVPTVHVRQAVQTNVAMYEHTVNDWWLRADGLPVRGVETKVSKSPSPIGAVTYREQYRIDVEATAPLR